MYTYLLHFGILSGSSTLNLLPANEISLSLDQIVLEPLTVKNFPSLCMPTNIFCDYVMFYRAFLSLRLSQGDKKCQFGRKLKETNTVSVTLLEIIN